MKEYQESKLPNGLSVITGEDRNADIVTLAACFRAGSRYERESELGYAHLLEHLILKGTTLRPSVEEVNAEADRAGAHLNAHARVENVRVDIKVVEGKKREMCKLLAEVIVKPLLDEGTLEKEKAAVREEMHQFRDNRKSRVWAESLARVFLGHPLSQHPLGKEDIVAAATSQGLQNYYRRLFTPSRGAVFALGNINHREFMDLVQESLLGAWDVQENTEESSTPPVPRNGIERFAASEAQTQLFFSYVSPRRGIRETVALKLIANILTHGRTAILAQELRHRAGLVYSVKAYEESFQDANLFYISTASVQPEEVILIVTRALNSFESSFREGQLEEFKDQFRGVLAVNLSSPSYEAEFLQSLWTAFGKMITPQDILSALTALTYNEILDIKNSHLTKENLLISMFGGKGAEAQCATNNQRRDVGTSRQLFEER